MVEGRQDLPLGHYLLLEVEVGDVLLLQYLERINLVVLVGAHQQHFGVAALPNHTQSHIIVDGAHSKNIINNLHIDIGVRFKALFGL